ncbi:hypothetical protein FLW53_09500 [Microbispora sp. SCL1-1]|uniref:DUF6221 family protein n=1 Tax=unclassified Microbispora TaxID=2614687 RepID=UPI0011588FA3|nr:MULTISPECIES: DUF6221 family protein [unclassified Microbispora]NJP24437.1 hypothetical protein [Microbispora sp. CL1-1]TQS14585.1 hypothetical protein FLW53_09500 [Microbispora sp. SCL1-1]
MTEHPLTAFLRARYDEREQAARAAKPGVNPLRGEWSFADMQVRDDAGRLVVKHTWPNEGEHIALNDPAFVLADVDSKRKILDAHHPMEPARGRGQDPLCAECSHGPDEYYTVDYPCLTVRLLAEPFASHPDYPKDPA